MTKHKLITFALTLMIIASGGVSAQTILNSTSVILKPGERLIQPQYSITASEDRSAEDKKRFRILPLLIDDKRFQAIGINFGYLDDKNAISLRATKIDFDVFKKDSFEISYQKIFKYESKGRFLIPGLRYGEVEDINKTKTISLEGRQYLNPDDYLAINIRLQRVENDINSPISDSIVQISFSKLFNIFNQRFVSTLSGESKSDFSPSTAALNIELNEAFIKIDTENAIVAGYTFQF